MPSIRSGIRVLVEGQRCSSKPGRERRSGSPEHSPLPEPTHSRSSEPVHLDIEKPAAGRRWQRARLRCSAGRGAPHSASASHSRGVDDRHQDLTHSRRYCDAQIIYRNCENVTWIRVAYASAGGLPVARKPTAGKSASFRRSTWQCLLQDQVCRPPNCRRRLSRPLAQSLPALTV